MAQCSRCGKMGGMFDVKMYNLPNKQDKLLCTPCYQEVIRTGEYFQQGPRPQMQQPQMRCPGCNNPVAANFKICPYCGNQIAGATQPPQPQGASCPGCGGTISAEFKVCPHCGKKLDEKPKEEPKKDVKKGKFCSECGAEIVGEQKFCGSCGAKTN